MVRKNKVVILSRKPKRLAPYLEFRVGWLLLLFREDSQFTQLHPHSLFNLITVLDDFRLANLECKASAYQYFQKLHCPSSPMFPEGVPSLYAELRRMSRIWRWMKKLKWAGFGHKAQETTDANPGELANFCPACPQPGINVAEAWMDDPQKYLTIRGMCMMTMTGSSCQVGLPVLFCGQWKLQSRPCPAAKSCRGCLAFRGGWNDEQKE